MYVVPSQVLVVQAPIISGRLSGLLDVVRRRCSAWASRRRELATARALYYATDMELRDMGINRSDIPAVVNRTYCRD